MQNIEKIINQKVRNTNLEKKMSDISGRPINPKMSDDHYCPTYCKLHII